MHRGDLSNQRMNELLLDTRVFVHLPIGWRYLVCKWLAWAGLYFFAAKFVGFDDRIHSFMTLNHKKGHVWKLFTMDEDHHRLIGYVCKSHYLWEPTFISSNRMKMYLDLPYVTAAISPVLFSGHRKCLMWQGFSAHTEVR